MEEYQAFKSSGSHQIAFPGWTALPSLFVYARGEIVYDAQLEIALLVFPGLFLSAATMEGPFVLPPEDSEFGLLTYAYHRAQAWHSAETFS